MNPKKPADCTGPNPPSPAETGNSCYAEWARRKGIPPYPGDDCCLDRTHCQTCRKTLRETDSDKS